MLKKDSRLLLMTPVKNEEKHIKKVINSVINQTLPPKLWIIVTGESEDKTNDIVDEYTKKYEWMIRYHIESDKGPRDLSKYGWICKMGFDYAIKYAEQRGIYWKYIGLLDGDSVIEKSYFEKLINYLEKHPEVGIVSGTPYHLTNKKIKKLYVYPDSPIGPGRVWRKECFMDTGGYLPYPGPEIISRIKAKNKGWKLRVIPEAKLIELRRSATDRGILRGYWKKGEIAYYLWYHPIYVMLSGLRMSLEPPFYQGLGLIMGYISSAINEVSRIEDEEIKSENYYNWFSIIKKRINNFINLK